jgi:hypothetical protein
LTCNYFKRCIYASTANSLCQKHGGVFCGRYRLQREVEAVNLTPSFCPARRRNVAECVRPQSCGVCKREHVDYGVDPI